MDAADAPQSEFVKVMRQVLLLALKLWPQLFEPFVDHDGFFSQRRIAGVLKITPS